MTKKANRIKVLFLSLYFFFSALRDGIYSRMSKRKKNVVAIETSKQIKLERPVLEQRI